MEQAAWRGRRVLVTGHTGFKGSWLVHWLQSMGASVTGFALPPPTTPSLFELSRAAQGMVSIIGDVTDLHALDAAVREHRPEVVFHLAAQSLVRLSYDAPVTTYATNVMGTVNVLEAIRRSPDVRAAVIVTSDKCYENREWVWGYREHEPMGGHDPYSSSKGCAELVTAAYRASFFRSGDDAAPRAAIATGRAGNVIGGGDWARDRLVPDIMRCLAESRPIVIRNPDAVRPWQHVLEPLGGYLLLAERLLAEGDACAGAWNFGPRDVDCRPVRSIVSALVEQWGGDASWQHDVARHPHEATFLKLDSSKAGAGLGWRPSWDLETALRRIVEWHKAFGAGDDMREMTLGQIRAYAAGMTTGASTAVPPSTH